MNKEDVIKTKTKMSKKDYKTLLEEQRDRLDDFKNAMLVSNLRDSSTGQYFTEWFNHIVEKSIELDESCDDLVKTK